jgi:deazaflavin-dependent oxidoreductase (nitroreductase family)
MDSVCGGVGPPRLDTRCTKLLSAPAGGSLWVSTQPDPVGLMRVCRPGHDGWVEIVKRPQRPAGVRRLAYRLPVWLYRARLGCLLGHRFVLINHTGRTSGRLRQVVVEVAALERYSGAVTVVSGFGPGSDWYHNLLAHAEASIQLGGRTIAVRAVPVPPDQAAEVMADYARRHPRAARALARFMGFAVDGSDADCRAVGRRLPVLRLEPH